MSICPNYVHIMKSHIAMQVTYICIYTYIYSTYIYTYFKHIYIFIQQAVHQPRRRQIAAKISLVLPSCWNGWRQGVCVCVHRFFVCELLCRMCQFFESSYRPAEMVCEFLCRMCQFFGSSYRPAEMAHRKVCVCVCVCVWSFFF